MKGKQKLIEKMKPIVADEMFPEGIDIEEVRLNSCEDQSDKIFNFEFF